MSRYEQIKQELNLAYNDFYSKCETIKRCPEVFNKEFIDKQLFNYAARLVDGYGENNSKRLLVVGLEIAGNRKESVDNLELVDKVNVNTHWFATMLTVIKFYYNFDNAKMKQLEKSKEELLELYNNIVKNKLNFAFTDYLKCGLSNDKEKMQKNVTRFKCMFENCAVLMAKEIQILKPDLIVFQNIDIFDYLNANCNNIIKKEDNPIYEKDLYKDKNENIEMKLWECKLLNENSNFIKKFYSIESYFPRSTFLSTNNIDAMEELYEFIDKYKMF